MNWKSVEKPEPFDLALYGLVITVIIAIIYGWQLREMIQANTINSNGVEKTLEAAQKSTDAANKALKISERAFMHVGPIESYFDIKKDREPLFKIPIENSGHQPSEGFAIQINKTSTLFPPNGGEPKLLSRYTTFFGGEDTRIPPGKDYYSFSFEANPLTPEERKFISGDESAGDIGMNLAGTLYWGDGFGRIETGGFCFTYNPDPRIK